MLQKEVCLAHCIDIEINTKNQKIAGYLSEPPIEGVTSCQAPVGVCNNSDEDYLEARVLAAGADHRVQMTLALLQAADVLPPAVHRGLHSLQRQDHCQDDAHEDGHPLARHEDH